MFADLSLSNLRIIKGSNTTLLTALAETIHTNDETLHLKLCEKLDHDIKSFVKIQLLRLCPRDWVISMMTKL